MTSNLTGTGAINSYDTSALTSMSVQELRQELAKSIEMTAASLLYMGNVWRELEFRGEDLSDLRSGLGAFLPSIASGRLRPEAVVRFAGKIMLLKKIEQLSLEEQDELLRKDTLEVVEISAGKTEVKTIPLAAVRSEHIRAAFGPAGIRSAAQQERLVSAVKPKYRRKRQMDPTLNISPDGYLRAGRAMVTARGLRIHIDDLRDLLTKFDEGKHE